MTIFQSEAEAISLTHPTKPDKANRNEDWARTHRSRTSAALYAADTRTEASAALGQPLLNNNASTQPAVASPDDCDRGAILTGRALDAELTRALP